MESIRNAIERASRRLTLHPQGGAAPDEPARAVHEGGLRFRIEGSNGAVISDMSKAVGGGASAPTPGWLLRAALASCDATLVAMEAARDGVELTDLTVTVESESDSRGLLGVDDSIPPGPLAVRVRIELAAPNATENHLRDIARRAQSRSPVRDAFVRAVSMTSEIMTADREAPYRSA
jgi:uncharacterized OsmC-like protein